MLKGLNTEPTKRQKVINTIREHIRSGQLPPGNRLATVREMSDYFEISSSVVHSALKELVDYGMIECRGAGGFYVREPAEKAASAAADFPAETAKTASQPRPGKTYLCCGHHSDLVWKYPLAGYEKIREKQWNDIRRFLKEHPDFHAFVEQSEALRPYLTKHPDALPEFQTAVCEKRLTLTGGFTIPDLNLCSGELLVRNLQDGKRWYRETFGTEVTIGCMDDAFGMCGQLPQVLAKSGYSFLLPGRRPNFPAELDGNIAFLWRGPDGSTVTVTPPNAFVSQVGYEINLPITQMDSERLYETLLEVRNSSFSGDMFVQYFTETHPLSEEMFWQIDAVNRTGGKRNVTFGSILDYCRSLETAGLPEISGEFNPIFTGCYTTRIQVKQKMRRGENLLFAAEMLGAGTNCSVRLDDAWTNLELASFHDSLCGCHHDNVYEEMAGLMDRAADKAEKEMHTAEKTLGSFTVFNPDSTGGLSIAETPCDEKSLPEGVRLQKDGDSLVFETELPPCGVKGFKTVSGKIADSRPESNCFRTDFYEADFSGPLPVIRSLNGTDVFAPDGFGEILFRRDIGSMWSEFPISPWFGAEKMKEEVKSILSGDVFIQVVTEGKVLSSPAVDGGDDDYWGGFGSLSFRKEYRFYRHQDYFTLKLRLDWKGNNTKIAVRFPTNCDPFNAGGTYDVPFGAVERKPYFEVPKQYESTMIRLNPHEYAKAAGGEWPAQHWVDLCDHRFGLAVANNGSAAYSMSAGKIIASLLRSPTRIEDGCMLPQPGAWDNGIREYEFAFRAHRPGQLEKAVSLGRILNRKPIVLHGNASTPTPAQSFVSLDCGNLVISSLRAFKEGWILRCYETLGRGCDAKLSVSLENFELMESDLTEQNARPLPDAKVHFEPFEIKTFQLVRKG